jgi:DNA invertase Pin-like site-specific DNA recombinase
MPLDDAERAQVLSRVERLQLLLDQLEHASGAAAERVRIRERMRRELDAAKEAIRTLGTHDPA